MKINYDKNTDALYLHFNQRPTDESEEIAPDTVAHFDEDGELTGIEFYAEASRKVDLDSIKSASEQTQTPEDAGTLWARYDSDLVREALPTLDPQEREALRLRFEEGLDLPEIRTQLGLTLAQTYRLLKKALRDLKGKLADNDAAPENGAAFEALEAELLKL